MSDLIINRGPVQVTIRRDGVAAATDAVAAAAALLAADLAATAGDRVQTGLDRVATAADRVQTGLDVAAANSAAATAVASYDAFDDRYLGAKAADPTLDNDGNALQVGAQYWSTTSNAIKVYQGGGIWAFSAATMSDLANATDTAKGGALVGYRGGTVLSFLDSLTAVSCERYGASPQASAATNSAAIQAALTAGAGGVVQLLAPGVYSVDRTLVISSKTRFIRAPGVRLKAVTGGPRTLNTFHLFENANFSSQMQAVTGIVVTQPWKANPELGVGSTTLFQGLATVTFTSFNPVSAGWVAGNHVLVKGDTGENFNGIWEIYGVTSTTVTFIISQDETTTAGAGTMAAALADADIQILGGLNDANFPGGFNASTDYHDHGFCFNRVLRLKIEDQKFYSARKYAVMMANVQNPVVRNIHGESASDGVHIYGPAWYPVVENVSGAFGDDCVILQTIDGTSFYSYMPPIPGTLEARGGSFYNGAGIRGVTLHRNRGVSVALYPDGGPGGANYKMFGCYDISDLGISRRDVNGVTVGGEAKVTVGAGYVLNAGSIEALRISNIRGRVNVNNAGPNVRITIGSLIIDGMTSDQTIGVNYQHIYDYCTIGQLTYRNMTWLGTNSINNLFIAASTNVTISRLDFEGCNVSALGGTLTLIKGVGATITRIGICQCVFGPVVVLNDDSTWASPPAVVFNDVTIAKTLVTTTGTQGYTIQAHMVKGIAGCNLFNFYSFSGTVNLSISHMDNAGNLFANQTGTINYRNPDGTAPVDLTKIARLAGAMAKASVNTGSGSASDVLANNMVVCDATAAAGSWKQMSAPATRSY